MACSLPGSSVHGIFQAKVLEWVAISSYTYTYIQGFFFFVLFWFLVFHSANIRNKQLLGWVGLILNTLYPLLFLIGPLLYFQSTCCQYCLSIAGLIHAIAVNKEPRISVLWCKELKKKVSVSYVPIMFHALWYALSYFRPTRLFVLFATVSWVLCTVPGTKYFLNEAMDRWIWHLV